MSRSPASPSHAGTSAASGAAAAPTIDLNADCGEGMPEEDLLPLLSSASVACAAHAGGEAEIRATLALARRHGVVVGAHPGFPDRAGFGRRVTTRDPAAIEALIIEQVELLSRLAREAGLHVAFVKPHGALYNLAAVEDDVACAIARAVRSALPGAPLVLLAGARTLAAVRALAVEVAPEGYADRAYADDGTLAPRSRTGAVIEDRAEAARRAVAIARDGCVASLDGRAIELRAATLCIHGDNPAAAAIARSVRDALRAAGIRVAPFAR